MNENHEAATVKALEGIERSLHILATRPTAYPTDLLNLIYQEIKAMSAIVNQLKADVTALKTVEDSAVQLLNNLAQLIRDNVDDQPALQQLATDIEKQSSDLAAAVVANTPASSTPPPPDTGSTQPTFAAKKPR